MNLGARAPIDLLTIIAQVTRVQDRSQYAIDPGNRDATWLAVGAEYALSRRTVIYTSLASIGNRNGSQYNLGSSSAKQPAGSVGPNDPRVTTAVLGLRHSF
jgi:predicted porin